MTILVLDASVAVKWAVPSSSETLVSEARELLRRYTDGDLEFVVPDVFWAEVANVMWKGVRQRRWPRATAESAASDMWNRDFPTVSSLALLNQAMQIAFTHDRSVYDCLYIALAVQRNTEFVTADEKLANAVAAYLPVKWLGAY